MQAARTTGQAARTHDRRRSAPPRFAGTLVEVLAEHALPRRTTIHALHTRGRPTPPEVTVFLDHLAARLRDAGLSGA